MSAPTTSATKDDVSAAVDRSQPAPARTMDAAALFRAHARFVARLLYRAGVARSEVDDLVQEVFLIAHRKGGFTQGEAKPTTWLARIALKVAANHRRKGRAAPAGDATQRVVASESAADARAASDAQRALWELDEGKRLVFVLYELEGVGGEEIAQELGVPVGTVYSRLHAARREFKAALEGQPEAPAGTKAVTR